MIYSDVHYSTHKINAKLNINENRPRFACLLLQSPQQPPSFDRLRRTRGHEIHALLNFTLFTLFSHVVRRRAARRDGGQKMNFHTERTVCFFLIFIKNILLKFYKFKLLEVRDKYLKFKILILIHE